jgi:chromosomal replication initiator protein
MSETCNVVAPATLPAAAVITFAMTIENVGGALGYALPKRAITMKEIAQEVCLKRGVSMEQLRGPRRTRDIAWPRQEAMWQMVEAGRWSLPQIGRFFHRDHTSILHGRRRHAARRVGAA